MKRWNRLAALSLVLALTAAACGGGGDDDDDTSGTTPPTEEDGEDGGSSGRITSMDEVEQAVVQIVAQGSFVEPGEVLGEAFEVTGAGSGSGAILDPEGIVVTNNHVVAGAATLEVYVGGDTDPISAKVLGVSECNDLAVIDLEGDGYPFLGWSGDEPSTGLEVRAAGFPLGDPEFTMTSGIVSKSEADGDMPWASIRSTIEHDANIQPGNSGGPLLNAEDATIVGIDYATSNPGTGTNQFLAISSALAQDVVETLRGEEDVLSLGINPQAIFFEEEGVVGVWVSSVATGSPAAEAGIQPGDIIEKIEGLPLATDGTMRDYCDILRSRNPDDVLTVQVLRYNEGIRLTGEINGDELVPSESLVDEVEEQTGGSLATGEAYEYATITDSTGVLVVDVPTAWSDLRTDTVTLEDGGTFPQIIAAPSVDGFLGTYDTPGMSFIVDATGATAVEDFMAASNFTGDCESTGPEPYEDALYTGQIEYWVNCVGSGGAVVVIAASPPGGEFTVRVVVQMVSDADAEALDQIIATFRVVTE